MSDPKKIADAISLIQLSQMLVALGTVVANAIQNGQDSVTSDELAASFADKDDALQGLAASIARAKAEGR